MWSFYVNSLCYQSEIVPFKIFLLNLFRSYLLSITWCKNSYCFDCILQITDLFIWYILDENFCILYGILSETNIGPPTSNQTLSSINAHFYLLNVPILVLSLPEIFVASSQGQFLLIFPQLYCLSLRQ